MSVDATQPTNPTKLSEGRLSEAEIYWRNHQEWLYECGYKLRPRFTPGWVPSWKTTGNLMMLCEDSYMLLYGQIIDAVQTKDGSLVVLKKVSKSSHPHEVDIANFFASDALADDPRNHCIRIIEVLEVPDDEDMVIIVMPLLRRYDNPRFDTVGEVVDFFRQIFEGIQFMHEHNIAHRDCNANNVMLDGRPLYPDGFHPRIMNHKPDFSGYAKHLTRTQRPPKYYIIDFGISRRYDTADKQPLEYPIWGGDRTVPEFLASNEPCDPFPTDVYYLGNLVRQEFLEGHPLLDQPGRLGLEFMRPLVDDMVQTDPKQRPTMDEVVSRFEDIRKNLSSWKLRSRVVPRKDTFGVSLVHAVKHWIRRAGFIVMRVPPVPC